MTNVLKCPYDTYLNCHMEVINSYNIPKAGGVGSNTPPVQPPVMEYVASQKGKEFNGVGGRDPEYYDSTPEVCTASGHTSPDFNEWNIPSNNKTEGKLSGHTSHKFTQSLAYIDLESLSSVSALQASLEVWGGVYAA